MTPDKTDDDKKGLDVDFIITILNKNKAQASLRDAELDMIGILAISMCIKTYNDTNSNTNSNDNSNDNDDDMKKVCNLLVMMLKDYHKKFNEKIVRDVLQLLVDIVSHPNTNSNTNTNSNDDDNDNSMISIIKSSTKGGDVFSDILGLGDALNRYELGEDIKTLCITIMMMIAPPHSSSSSSSSLSSKAAPPALLTKQHSV